MCHRSYRWVSTVTITGVYKKKFWDLGDILWDNTPGYSCRLLGEGPLSSLFPTANRKCSGSAAAAAFQESHQRAVLQKKYTVKKSSTSFIWKTIHISLHNRAGPRHDLWSKWRGSSWVRYPNLPFHLGLEDTSCLPQKSNTTPQFAWKTKDLGPGPYFLGASIEYP